MLEELDLPLSQCNKCPLHKGSTFRPHASYQGNLNNPDILFIGEAPQGFSKITQKENIGNMGRLLKRETKELGIEDYAYANLIACQHVKLNDWDKEVNKKPTTTQIKCCTPNLEAIIKQINPRIIAPLGATPTKKMGVKGKFNNVRAIIHDGKYGKVMPILHPGQVLMKPNFLSDFKRDLKSLQNWVEGHYIEEKPDGKYIIIDKLQDVHKLFKTLKVSKKYSFDIEATGLFFFRDTILGVGFCPKPGLAFYLPLMDRPDPKGELITFWGEDQGEVLNVLRAMLTLPIRKIAHNGKYDIKMLQHFLGIKIPNFWFDTMLAHYLIDENRGHGLKVLAGQYFPQFKNYDGKLRGILSQKKEDEGDFSNIPLEILGEYCAIDCDITLRLQEIFSKEMDEAQKKLLFRFYMPLSKVYIDAELKGVKVDKPYVEKLATEYEERKAELISTMFSIAGREFNPNSNPQLGKILYEDLGFPVIKKTDSGNPSTAEGTLKELPQKHIAYPFIKALMEYRSVDKMLSTYFYSILRKLDANNRLHPSFLLHGTVTGRLSSKLPNIQNIPRDPKIRGMFIPDEDYLFVSIDYSQIELRVMAFYSKDEVMTQAYIDGEDLHRKMASAIYKIKPEEVDKKKRKRAKLVNFGFLYGAQPKKAKESINEKADSDDEKITLNESKVLRQIFFDLYRGVKRYISRIHKQIHKQAYVTNIFGRIRRLPQVRSPLKEKIKEAEREGLNAIIQSTASDLTQLSVIRAHKLLTSYKSGILFSVHDEINFEIHKDEQFLIEQLKELMVDTPPEFDFPVEVEAEIFKERWKNQ